MTGAGDKGAAMAELLAVVERLGEVLARETASLATRTTRLDPAVTTEKSRLVARYETLMAAVAVAPPGSLRGLAGADRLRPAVEALERKARDNAAAIDRHLRATRHVIDIVTRAARRQTETSFSYGKTRLGYGIRSAGRPAVAVNCVS